MDQVAKDADAKSKNKSNEELYDDSSTRHEKVETYTDEFEIVIENDTTCEVKAFDFDSFEKIQYNIEEADEKSRDDPPVLSPIQELERTVRKESAPTAVDDIDIKPDLTDLLDVTVIKTETKDNFQDQVENEDAGASGNNKIQPEYGNSSEFSVCGVTNLRKENVANIKSEQDVFDTETCYGVPEYGRTSTNNFEKMRSNMKHDTSSTEVASITNFANVTTSITSDCLGRSIQDRPFSGATRKDSSAIVPYANTDTSISDNVTTTSTHLQSFISFVRSLGIQSTHPARSLTSTTRSESCAMPICRPIEQSIHSITYDRDNLAVAPSQQLNAHTIHETENLLAKRTSKMFNYESSNNVEGHADKQPLKAIKQMTVHSYSHHKKSLVNKQFVKPIRQQINEHTDSGHEKSIADEEHVQTIKQDVSRSTNSGSPIPTETDWYSWRCLDKRFIKPNCRPKNNLVYIPTTSINFMKATCHFDKGGADFITSKKDIHEVDTSINNVRIEKNATCKNIPAVTEVVKESTDIENEVCDSIYEKTISNNYKLLSSEENVSLSATPSASDYNYVMLDGIISLNINETCATASQNEYLPVIHEVVIDDESKDNKVDSCKPIYNDSDLNESKPLLTKSAEFKAITVEEAIKNSSKTSTKTRELAHVPKEVDGIDVVLEKGIMNVTIVEHDDETDEIAEVQTTGNVSEPDASSDKRKHPHHSSEKKKKIVKDKLKSIGPGLGVKFKIYKECKVERCFGCTTENVMRRVKERKTYADAELDDDDIEGKRLYKIEDKLASDKYNKDYVKRLHGEEFNLRYLQENGLQYPIIFAEKTGLGLRVPSDNFKVSDVKSCVGSRRMLDVMDVNTQKGLEMTMKEWTKYYEETNRDRLLNVISLEFSHTKLENYVESPNLVREVDWVDTAWPQHLKDCQTESTNAIDKMKYPKVQKYCLMSVAGCYTDFHIDFGGTSVWYHILHGAKVFWLIPPTDKNLQKYENWVLSGKQGDAFLADSIEECQMLNLVAGNTFIIPSGWIHAVYTPKDSLVFGGNFLHSFNMVNQLKVAGIEDKTHVPMKFRYPFYAEINWYVLERYVHSLTGVTYLEKPQLNDDLEVISNKMDSSFDSLEEKLNKRLSVSLTRIDDTSPRRKSSSDDDDSVASGPTRSPGQSSTQRRTGRKSSSESSNSLDLKGTEKSDAPKVPYKSPVKRKMKYVHLTKYELEGLIEVVAWVESLPPSKKGIPKDLIDPDTVLSEVKRLIQEHMRDNPELAITGEPVLEWTKATKKLIKLKQKVKTAKLLGTHCAPKVKSGGGKTASGNRHRRVRCKRCEPCTRDDCMECNFCKDMRKYGGPGRAKQSCISRQCLAPILPKGISCLLCNMTVCQVDRPVKTDGASDDDAEDFSMSLMECGLCWEITHPACLQRNNENYRNEGIVNEDLPNSWKCSKCCFAGKEGKLVTRVFKGGWRPNTASTPPPLSVSPPLQPASPSGDIDVMVTEGKRVTVNQALDNKHDKMPKLSPHNSYSDMETKPVKFEPDSDTDIKPMMPLPGKLKTEDTVKLEPADRTMGSTSSGERTATKRSNSPGQEEPAKKKRTVSPVPSKGASKSSKMGTIWQKSSIKKSQKSSSTPEVLTKRSKRETTPRNIGRCTYDFDDDDDDFMDISAPLPDKSKGKSPKGKRNLHIKQKSLSATFGSQGHSSKSNGNNLELKREDTHPVVRKHSDKMSSDQMKKTLIEHIEKRNLPIIKPLYAVRPAPISPPDDYFVRTNGQKHPLSRKYWMKVFAFLSQPDLARCQAVCKVWNRWCINPDLWKKIDLSKHRIVQAHLMGIVRRQPEYLNLSSVIMTQKQILWLLERIPLLKELIVAKCSWATISGLCMSSCPLLYKLDVSWATGLNDKCFEDLITPPVDRKPAVKNISRLHRLKSLHLSGTEVTDASLELMTIHLSQLEELNVSYCTRINDQGIKMLASSKSATQDSLKCLNISGCRGLTEVSIEAIRNLSSLEVLYAVNCIRIPADRCKSLRMQRLKVFKF